MERDGYIRYAIFYTALDGTYSEGYIETTKAMRWKALRAMMNEEQALFTERKGTRQQAKRRIQSQAAEQYELNNLNILVGKQKLLKLENGKTILTHNIYENSLKKLKRGGHYHS